MVLRGRGLSLETRRASVGARLVFLMFDNSLNTVNNLLNELTIRSILSLRQENAGASCSDFHEVSYLLLAKFGPMRCCRTGGWKRITNVVRSAGEQPCIDGEQALLGALDERLHWNTRVCPDSEVRMAAVLWIAL